MPSNRSTKKVTEKIPIPNPADKKSFMNHSALLLFSCVHAEETTEYPAAKQSPNAKEIFIYRASSPAKSRTPLPKSSISRRFGGRSEGGKRGKLPITIA
jgi:hypothetical protein